jgi:hypothetical protein
MRDIPIPSDWNEEIDGWETAIVCLPNSVEWRAVFLGAIQALHYGPLWERETGDIKQTQQIIDQIVEGIRMNCNETFERQAVALEGIQAILERWYDSDHIELLGFIEGLIAQENPALAGIISWIGEWGELLAAIGLPNLPNISLNPTGLFHLVSSLFTNTAFRNHLQDITLALNTQNIATNGPGVEIVWNTLLGVLPGLADTFVDHVLLGDLDEHVSLSTSAIITALTGNYVTNKLDDIRNATNGGSILPGDNVVNQLKLIKQTVSNLSVQISVSTQPGGVDGCGCITVGPEPAEPSEGDDPADHGGPPPDGFEDWTVFDQYKCRYSNKIVDEFINILTVVQGLTPALFGLSVAAGILIIAAVITGLAAIPIFALALAVGTVSLVVFGAFAGIILTVDGEVFLDNWIDGLEDDKDAIVCALFLSQTPEAALSALNEWILDHATTAAGPLDQGDDLLEFATTLVEAILTNNLVNMMFPDLANAEFIPIDYIGEVDCQSCTLDNCPFVITTGSGTPVHSGTSFTASAADVGGGVYVLEMLTDVTCIDNNWCVLIVSRTAMNNTSANYTRKLYSNANGVHNYNFEDFDWNSDPADCFPDVATREYPISGCTFASDGPFDVEFRVIKSVAAVDADPSASTACD